MWKHKENTNSSVSDGKKIKMSQKDLYIVLSNEDVPFTALTALKPCVSLKEKVAGEEGKWGGGDPPCRYFTNTLTKENVICYLSFGFRELICIEMSHLQENR